MEQKQPSNDIRTDLVAAAQTLFFMDEESFLDFCRGARAYYDCGGRTEAKLDAVTTAHHELQRIFMTCQTLEKAAFLDLARNAYRILAAGAKNGLNLDEVIEITECLSLDPNIMEEQLQRLAETLNIARRNNYRWRV